MTPGRLAAVGALVFIAILTRLPSAVATEVVPDRRVLVLFSHQRLLPVNVLLDNEFRARFGATAPDIEYMVEFVESTRFSEASYEARLSQYLVEKYRNRRPDVLLTVGPDALDFVLDQRDQFYPDVPVVFSFVREADIHDRTLPPDVTGAFTGNEALRTLELALRLQPETERVVVVGSRYAEFDQRYLQEARKELQPFEDRLAIEYWDDLTVDEVRERVARLSAGTIILYVALSKDRLGFELFPTETLDQMADVASVPIYSVAEDWYIGRGALAGRFTPLTIIGSHSASMGLRILRGEARPPLEPPQQLDMTTAVDWRQVERWNISENRVPADAEIRFREPTLWQQYRFHIMGVLGLCALQSLLIAGLLAQRARRRHVQRALEESQERIAMILDAASLGVAFWNFRTGKHTCNERFRQLLRLEACEACRLGEVVHHVHPSDRDWVKQAIDQAISERNSFDLEFRVVDVPGEKPCWIELKGRCSGGTAQLPDRWKAVAFDVTRRRAAELEQQARREELAHLNRVSTAGMLSASITHEIRQPLSVIIHSAEAALWMLRDGQFDAHEAEKTLQAIFNSAVRASEVLQRVRTFVKKEAATQIQVDANELVGETVRLVQAQMQRQGIELELDLDARRPTFCGDRVQIQQVLVNLLINAMEAMEEDRLSRHHVVVRTHWLPSQGVQIAVADTGPGFEPGVEERLFESFYTTKSSGLGMGLPICRTILEAHGGRLWAEQNRDRGATFFLLLPLAANKATTEPASPAESSPGCAAVRRA